MHIFATVQKIVYTEEHHHHHHTNALCYKSFFAPGEVNGIMITIDRVTDCDIVEMAMISIISSHNSNNCLS